MSMSYVRETVVTTKNIDGSIKVSPLGVYIEKDILRLKPFKPSGSLENIIRNKSGVINYIDDVRIFASCITKKDIEIDFVKAKKIDCSRLKKAISHTEFKVSKIEDDKQRPTIICKPIYEETHNMFYGFNRAKSAIIELCILVSRLGIIEDKKIEEEIKYLDLKIEKCSSIEELITKSEIVVTTTPSKSPLIKNEWLKKGLHITAMGSDAESKNELDPVIIKECDLYIPDSLSQTKILGELHHAIEKNLISVSAPLCKAMINKKVNDVFEVQTPNGIKEFQINSIDFI